MAHCLVPISVANDDAHRAVDRNRWHRLRHRHPAQIAVIAPFAIIALIGVLGLVIDIGMFRLIDSELENAADAAALAAAWYDPVCPDPTPLAIR